ncbi:PAS domain-containing protein [Telmatospirillum sp.]|uniref:PAS domain-containing hybrid sensor histidine kinase/response regulator n=1 Tax=Telmatospirillum sp. TaxID=2079197 RepID=UPI00284512D3|nr:PAS domain-containing protein [Telmatospirillum sp.]MDR3438512.1 PAS domain-containing protein [Telmatospirillum sp.]
MSCVSKASSAAEALRTTPLTWLVLGAVCLLVGLALSPLDGQWQWTAVFIVTVVALAAIAGLLSKLGDRARRSVRTGRLEAALGGDHRARLVFDADGQEILRNAMAEQTFGPPEAPCAPLLLRVSGDERAEEELQRLAAAARHGGSHSAEISLPGAQGGRDWLALAVYPLGGGGILWTAEDVSARRAIEETLRRDHEMLADFIDFMPVGFYSADTEGRFRFVNQRLAEWIGHPAEALVGQELVDVLGVVPNPEEDRAEMRLKGRNGDVFQAFVTHTVFDEGGETLTRSIVVRDLMPERHWERALKASDRRFHWLFEDAPVGIVLVDPDTTVSLCNPAFAEMAGVTAEEVIGSPVVDFIAEDDKGPAAEHLGRVLMGTSPGTHLPVRLAGRGGEMVATLYVSPAADEGGVSGLMLHFIDTTEQKNLELQFAQSQKMQAMGQLAGGIAHDFNNLLTAMIGFCDLLLQRHGPGDASFADIMQIKQNANRAASLVRQLLAFSRRQALQPRLFDVTDALAELSNLLRRLLGETIELSITHGRDLGLVRVDPGQFDQVIINLAVNARDAMLGGGQLSVMTRVFHNERPYQRGADVMPPGDYVLIEVADTGTGISPENLGRIFEPFFSTKEVGAGTGLGLSTVYGIVRQTDGFVFVDSQPGHGSIFSIYLPRFDGAEPGVRAKFAGGEQAAQIGDLTGTGTILIVEDEDAVRLFGARALRNKGYRVLEARSGENALDVLHGEEGVDVLVSDVVMPGMDGATLARLVRMERPHIQVILMSGYAEDVALGEFSGEDGIHFLPKPFSLKQLASKVKDVLGEVS